MGVASHRLAAPPAPESSDVRDRTRCGVSRPCFVYLPRCLQGNPSGHVMITLVVLLTCLDHVKRGGRRKRLQQLVWVAVCVVGVSRVLISSHFLHQILCGLLFGVLIHAAISRHLSTLLHSSTNSKFCAMIGVAVVMVSLALFLFHSWTRLGMDPGFSIALAKR